MSSITNVVVDEIPIINKTKLAEVAAFKDYKIKSILPKITRKTIKFDLLNANPALANAIRLTVLEELDWKAFEISPNDIKTNEKNILINEFCDRIMLMPINQDIPDDAVFGISFVADHAGGIIKSDVVNQIGGKKFAGQICDLHRIAVLGPKKFLQVKNIRVVHGKGYENSKFTTCCFTYQLLDYIGIRSMESYHLELNEIAKVVDVLKHAKIKSKGPAEDYDALAGKRIMAITNPNVMERASEETKKRILSSDIIIEERLPEASSLVEMPKHFRLGFEFHNVDNPKAIVVRALEDIADRLNLIKSAINIDGSVNNPDMVSVVLADNKCQIVVRGEDDSISRLLVYYILELVPDIPLVNTTKIHANLRSFKLRIMHPQHLKILHDAIDYIIKLLAGLVKQL